MDGTVYDFYMGLSHLLNFDIKPRSCTHEANNLLELDHEWMVKSQIQTQLPPTTIHQRHSIKIPLWKLVVKQCISYNNRGKEPSRRVGSDDTSFIITWLISMAEFLRIIFEFNEEVLRRYWGGIVDDNHFGCNAYHEGWGFQHNQSITRSKPLFTFYRGQIYTFLAVPHTPGVRQ